LQLNPNDYLAHEFYSWLLAIQGDFDNGIAEGQRSLEADPLSVEAEVILGLDYYLARRFPEALDTFRKSIDLNPDYPPDYWGMGLVYMAQNQPKDAAATLEKGLKIAPLDWSSEVLAAAYATQGDRAKAQKILDDYAARAKSGGYVPQYFLSYAYLALGDRNRALTALEKDYENRTEYMTFLKTDPYLDSLRNEPRFQALLKKMKFQ
jgi:tetratricopeptide (TPR) repeat protein